MIIIRFNPTGNLNWYILQKNITIYGQIITDGELVVKAQQLSTMQVYTNCYWNQKPKQYFITVSTHKILNPQLEVN